MSHHQAKFFWGAGAQSVHIAGNFNNWSATATPLQKLPDGTFAAEVPLPWGEKQAFKYVVDGEWKVREDEAKEWDAAGNMNNVYTAPPASVAEATSTAHTSERDTASPASAPATKTEPEALFASSAPGAAASSPTTTSTTTTAEPKTQTGGYTIGGITLGGPIGSSKPATTSTSTSTTTTKAVETNSTPAPVVSTETTIAADPAAKSVGAEEPTPLSAQPTHVQIEQVAKNSNIGEAPTEPEQPGLFARAAEFSTAAVAAATAAYGSAAAAVEHATGIDLSHGSPLSVEEAKAQGIDVNSLKAVDAANDTPSPVGTAPSRSAVAALEEKVQELKVDSSNAPHSQVDVPLPNGEGPKRSVADDAANLIQPKEEVKPEHDLPAQDETVNNHTIVPAPVIVAVSERDPAKDRSLDAPNVDDTIGTRPISSAPGDSAKVAKEQVDANPAGTSGPASNPAPAAAHSTPKPAPVAPATPVKQNGVAAAGLSTPAAPAAPAPTPASTYVPTSTTSTPASTPAKSTHQDGEKKKSGFLKKIKSVVSRKDKEKK